MKIILADEVRGLGHRGDVVDVKNGYARNFLLPQGLAFLANAANTRRLEEEKKRYDERLMKEKTVAEKVAVQMSGLRLTLVKKAGRGDVLLRLRDLRRRSPISWRKEASKSTAAASSSRSRSRGWGAPGARCCTAT
jgi:hypothetical protein